MIGYAHNNTVQNIITGQFYDGLLNLMTYLKHKKWLEMMFTLLDYYLLTCNLAASTAFSYTSSK